MPLLSLVPYILDRNLHYECLILVWCSLRNLIKNTQSPSSFLSYQFHKEKKLSSNGLTVPVHVQHQIPLSFAHMYLVYGSDTEKKDFWKITSRNANDFVANFASTGQTLQFTLFKLPKFWNNLLAELQIIRNVKGLNWSVNKNPISYRI